MQTSLLIETRAKRWQLYSALVLFGFVYGVVNNILLGRPERRVSYEVILVIPLCRSLVFFYRFLLRGRPQIAPAAPSELPEDRLNARLLYAVGLVIPVLALAFWIPSSPVYASLLDKRLRDLSSGTISDLPDRAEKVKRILVTAKNKKISLKPQTLQTVGEYFVKASEVDPAAWSAALTIAAYKSQNISLPPAGPVMSQRQMPASHIYYVEPWLMLPPANFNEFPADRGIPVTYELLGPEVPAESGAIAQLISAPGLGLLKDGRGPQYVYIETSAHMVLDEWDLKNIIFVGAHIVYRGGPSILENISYINCDFDIVPNDKGKQFVSSIFGPVTLGTSQKDVIP